MIYDTDGNPLNEMQFERISSSDSDLLAFLMNGKLGLLGLDGTIVIPPTYAVDVDQLDSFRIHENLLLLNTGGRISIVEISFVNTSSN